MVIRKPYVLFLIATHLSSAYASYGATVTLPLETSTPPHLRGYQIMMNYDPETLSWKHLNMYFDGGYSRFWVTNHTDHKSLTIYSIAPVVRYSFKRYGAMTPYLELSIGASYMTKTRLDGRNLGIHFAFQDRAGLGALLNMNDHHKLSFSLHAIHYSNAHLSDHNSGITVPLALDIGYQFG